MSAVCKSVCVWKGFCVKVSVCVPHLIRCKTSFYFCRGQRDLQSWPLPTKLHTGWSGIGTCLYIHILSRPWAHTSRSWGGDLYLMAVVLYCQWLLWLYFFDFYLCFIFLYLCWVCFLHVWCTPLHNSQWPFWASVLLMSARQDDVNPSGNTCLGPRW